MWLPRGRELSSTQTSPRVPASARASTSASRGSGAYGGPSFWCAVAAFVRRGCPTVAQVATGIDTAGGIPGIAICCRDLTVQRKLLPHFGEAGTAVFAVEHVE